MAYQRNVRVALLSAVAAIALGLGVSVGGGSAEAVTYASKIESDRIGGAGWDADGAPVGPILGTPDGNRNDPAMALGAPDTFFFSLGQDGKAVFGFDTSFLDPATIFEVTFVCNVSGDVCGNHPETADVYGLNSFDPDDDIGDIDLTALTKLGSVGNALAQSGQSVTFAGSYAFLLLHDTSTTTDGFDVDAISVQAVPVPAGLVLFLSGLAGVGFLGRYKAKRRETSVA